MSKVSIIVPVYNVENHIKECLHSLKKQTFNDYEVIVINDGSTDGSGEIAREICHTMENFYYFEHKNRGLGLTRNRGIELSRGEYIGFVDSDDIVPENMIEELYLKAIESNYDVVCGEMMFLYPDGSVIPKKEFKYIDDVIINDNYELFFRDYYFVGVYTHNAVDKLYKSEIIKKNNIKFGDNKIVFGEDNFFQLNLIKHINKIGFIKEPVYYYFQREGSIMNSYKENIGSRQLNMLKMLSNDNSDIVMEKAISLLTFDSIIMEILNIINYKLGYKRFCQQMNLLREDTFFVKNMRLLSELNSYEMISNKYKRYFIKTISFLENKKLYNLSNSIIYKLYRVRVLVRGD